MDLSVDRARKTASGPFSICRSKATRPRGPAREGNGPGFGARDPSNMTGSLSLLLAVSGPK